jgi:hypothetical protein
MTNPNFDTHLLLDGGYVIPYSQILCFREVGEGMRVVLEIHLTSGKKLVFKTTAGGHHGTYQLLQRFYFNKGLLQSTDAVTDTKFLGIQDSSELTRFGSAESEEEKLAKDLLVARFSAGEDEADAMSCFLAAEAFIEFRNKQRAAP